MKRSILIVATIFSFSTLADNPNSFFKIKSRTKKINQKEMTLLMREFLKESRPSRMVGTKGHMSAREFIKKYLIKEANGESIKVDSQLFKPQIGNAITMYESDFDREVAKKFKSNNPIYKKWNQFTTRMVKFLQEKSSHDGENIIWTKQGTDANAGTIVIGAHYDTMANDPDTKNLAPDSRQPGADDNASGVVTALLLAKYFHQMNFKQTIKIVFFDWEELGFLGSEAYVRERAKKLSKFLGYLNLEMIGYDSKLSDKKKKTGNMKIYVRKQNEAGGKEDMRLAQELTQSGEKLVPGITFTIQANSFNASDHLYFWKNNLTAVTFSENWETDFNPNYHTSSDVPETLNMDTLYNVYRYISGSITAKLLEIDK